MPPGNWQAWLLTARSIQSGCCQVQCTGRNMNDISREEINTLLTYLVEHNRDHEVELRDWATKIRPRSGTLSGRLVRAADKLGEASHFLEQALGDLNEIDTDQ